MRKDASIIGGPEITKSYDEFAATDPIGLSEFGGTVERILLAASKARLKTETSGAS
jgi:hypothetical protein